MKKVISSGLVAGLAMVVAGTLANYLLGLILPSVAAEYQGNAMFRPWSDPKMSLIFVAPFVSGLVLAWVWPKLKASCSAEKACCSNGLCLAMVYFMFSLAGMIISYSTFAISFLMVLTWTVTSLIEALIGGWVVAKMNK